MLLHFQGFDYILHYSPGKEMVLLDSLSHFHPKPGPEIALDIAIHHADLSSVQKDALQLASDMDVEKHALADIIISGWPDDIKEVPYPLCPYWQNCESLTVEVRLVFHGEALIIKVPGALHQSYQGITKTQLLIHGCVFWSGINKVMEEAVKQCEICTRFQA